MPKETWIIASILAVAALLGLLGLSSCNQEKKLAVAKVDLVEARAVTSKSESELAALKDKLLEAQTRVDELLREQESAVASHRSLEAEMRAALESKDVAISQLQGKLTVSILDRVLFDSGEADLKPDGAAVLRKVAGILVQHSNVTIHVIGHTDNIPIKASARTRFPSNWELSTARATAAVRFLTESGGVAPTRLGAVGYGEFRPVADNATTEGRARNRRIAITILSEELAGADTAAGVITNSAGSPLSRTTITNSESHASPSNPSK